MNYKIYYINLDSSVERRLFMEQQFDKFNIPATRVRAVNGNTLSASHLQEIKQNQSFLCHYSSPKNGEIGAFLSHHKAWNIISEQDEGFGIILEDDVLLNKKLFDDLDKIIRTMDQNDIVDISGRKGFYRLDKLKKNDHILFQFNTPPLGMMGKVYGKDAAKYLFRNLSDYHGPVDVMLQKRYQHKLEIWSVNQKYLTHNDKEIGGSTIQNNKNIMGKLSRELKRPFWRLFIIIRNILQSQL